jgi:transposase
VPLPLDQEVYRQRNVIERMFCRLKAFQRIATRYDKLVRNFLLVEPRCGIDLLDAQV